MKIGKRFVMKINVSHVVSCSLYVHAREAKLSFSTSI